MRCLLLTCCLVLAGCAGAASPGGTRLAAEGQIPPTGNLTLLRVTGQDTGDQPLLPQPGNIWADILPREEKSLLGTAASETSFHGNEPNPEQPDLPQAGPAAIGLTASPRRSDPAPGSAKKPAPPQSVAEAGERPMVQLAAATDAKQAVAAWHRLRQEAPGLTVGHDPEITAADVNGRHVWRLRAGGFDDTAAARTFCNNLRAANTDCWVVAASAIR